MLVNIDHVLTWFPCVWRFHSQPPWRRGRPARRPRWPGGGLTETAPDSPRCSSRTYHRHRTPPAGKFCNTNKILYNLNWVTIESKTFQLGVSLTFILPWEMSSAKCLVCINFLSASKSLKVCETVVWESNSLDLDESPSNSASHPDPSCLHMGLWLWLVS